MRKIRKINKVTISQALDIIRDYHSNENFPSGLSYPRGQRFYAWSQVDGVYHIWAAGKVQLLKCPGNIFPFHTFDAGNVYLNMTKLSMQALCSWHVVAEFTRNQLREKYLEHLGL